jgi:hypothetical protein
MLECKERDTRQQDFFPTVSRSWHSPLSTLEHPLRVELPCIIKKQVFTKNAPSSSPERRASNHVQSSLLGAPTNSKSSPRTSGSPRLSRCLQTPRVTSPKPSVNLHYAGPKLKHTSYAQIDDSLCFGTTLNSRSSSHSFKSFSSALEWPQVFRVSKAAQVTRRKWLYSSHSHCQQLSRKVYSVG